MKDEPRIPLTALDAMIVAAIRPHLEDGAVPADLRWRLKQMQRQEWPTNIGDDPHLKRGYTMRQALRVLSSMALADAGLGPTQSVSLARHNENTILSIMLAGIAPAAEERDERPRYGLLRPAALAKATDPNPLKIAIRSAKALAIELDDDVSGRSSLIIDFGGMAQRAVAACRAIGVLGPLEHLDQVLADGARETLAGRGYLATETPTGDRYASPRRTARTPG